MMQTILNAGLLRLAILVATASLVACDTQLPPEAPPPPQLEAETTLPNNRLEIFAYKCLINGYVVADFSQSTESIALLLPKESLQLPKQVSASGVRYSNGNVTFFSKGNEAFIEAKDSKDHCVEDRQASVLEDAKLRGVDYRASGNEPGWSLEISGSNMVFITGYGQSAYSFAISGHDLNRETRTVTYTSSTPNDTISARILGKTCSNGVNGKRFETAVEIEFNGMLYKGCGQGLR